ncbi:MAG: hypothetical protein ACLUAF_13020 [Paraclostridium sordellii]
MKQNILIYIKPIYVQQILSGEKKYEYRKSIFKKHVDKIYVYSTSPHKMIVGYFKYTGYIEGDPEKIWIETHDFSGIGKGDYDKYFNNRNKAYAIKIDRFIPFEKPIDPGKLFAKFYAPQSYKYLKEDII